VSQRRGKKEVKIEKTNLSDRVNTITQKLLLSPKEVPETATPRSPIWRAGKKGETS